jgi:hypothetical protein
LAGNLPQRPQKARMSEINRSHQAKRNTKPFCESSMPLSQAPRSQRPWAQSKFYPRSNWTRYYRLGGRGSRKYPGRLCQLAVVKFNAGPGSPPAYSMLQPLAEGPSWTAKQLDSSPKSVNCFTYRYSISKQRYWYTEQWISRCSEG